MVYSTPERYLKSVRGLNQKYVANEEAEKAAAVAAAAAAPNGRTIAYPAAAAQHSSAPGIS